MDAKGVINAITNVNFLFWPRQISAYTSGRCVQYVQRTQKIKRSAPFSVITTGTEKEASKRSTYVLTLELGKSKLVNYNAIKGVNVDICARAYFHAPSIVSSSV